MTIKYSIKTDFKNLTQWAQLFGEKHIPYVAAKTLTDLASEVNCEAIKSLGQYFTLRNKYVIRSIRKQIADKRQWPYCYSQAGSIAPFMDLQVSGGQKEAKKGAWLGVPKADGKQFLARPTPLSAISKPLWINKLLEKSGYLMIKGKNSHSPILLKQKGIRKRKNKKHATTAHKKRTHHTGKRGWKRETTYVMKKKVSIHARFPFYQIAKSVIDQRYESLFKKNLQEAIQ